MESPCRHRNYEPVTSVVTGEHLATICTDCLDEMPLHYEGDTVAISRLGSPEPVAYIPVV